MTVDEALTYAQMATSYGCTTEDQHCMRVLGNEVNRLRDEAEHRKHGFCNSHFTVYGTEAACKQLGEWYGELMEYRRKEAREEELQALRAENAELRSTRCDGQVHLPVAEWSKLKTENAQLRQKDSEAEIQLVEVIERMGDDTAELRAELAHTKRCVRAVCDYTGLTGNEVEAICGKPMVNP